MTFGPTQSFGDLLSTKRVKKKVGKVQAVEGPDEPPIPLLSHRLQRHRRLPQNVQAIDVSGFRYLVSLAHCLSCLEFTTQNREQPP